ncbi:hypothetical protein HZS_6102 [Henneguya salminicola]|nr:hypothetical protein HZS_6102 [Henneguya salminicola]
MEKYTLFVVKETLVISSDTVTKKGLHTCTNRTRVVVKEILKTLLLNYIENYISDKSSSLDLYSNEIYNQLLPHLRNDFVGTPNQIPSKNWVYSKIRETRGEFNFNAIQTISMAPYSIIGNK